MLVLVLALMGGCLGVGRGLRRGVYVVSQGPDFGVAVGWRGGRLGTAWDCLITGARHFGVSDV